MAGHFRIDMDALRDGVYGGGVHEVKWSADGNTVVIEDTRSRNAIYVAATLEDVVNRAAVAARTLRFGSKTSPLQHWPTCGHDAILER